MKIHLKRVILLTALIVFSICVYTYPAEYYRMALIIVNYSVAGQMGSTNLTEIVQPDLATTVIQPFVPYAKTSWESRQPFAVIMVTSTAEEFGRRNTIRTTWAKSAAEQNICVYFLVGVPDDADPLFIDVLYYEGLLYDDLIVERYDEGYYKLTGKVMRMLKWFSKTYQNSKWPLFFVKTDTDVFINLPNLRGHLENTAYYKNQKNSSEPLPVARQDRGSYFLGGLRISNTSVEESPFSKYFIDPIESRRMKWPIDLPTYLVGSCYVLSGNLVELIYQEALTLPNYPFEDVFITGIVGNARLGLQADVIPDMMLKSNYSKLLVHPQQRQQITAMHSVKSLDQMVNICKSILACNGSTNAV